MNPTSGPLRYSEGGDEGSPVRAKSEVRAGVFGVDPQRFVTFTLLLETDSVVAKQIKNTAIGAITGCLRTRLFLLNSAILPSSCRCAIDDKLKRTLLRMSQAVKHKYTRTPAGKWIMHAALQHLLQHRGIHAGADPQPFARHQHQFQSCVLRRPPSGLCLHQSKPHRRRCLQPLSPIIEGLLGEPLFRAKLFYRYAALLLPGDPRTPILTS